MNSITVGLLFRITNLRNCLSGIFIQHLLDFGLSSEGIATDKVRHGHDGPGRLSWAIRPSIMVSLKWLPYAGSLYGQQSDFDSPVLGFAFLRVVGGDGLEFAQTHGFEFCGIDLNFFLEKPDDVGSTSRG